MAEIGPIVLLEYRITMEKADVHDEEKLKDDVQEMIEHANGNAKEEYSWKLVNVTRGGKKNLHILKIGYTRTIEPLVLDEVEDLLDNRSYIERWRLDVIRGR